MGKEVSNIADAQLTILSESVAKKKIPDKMMRDAFMALSVSIFQEFFLSSDTKFFLFNGMKVNLQEMGYSDEEMKDFVDAFNEAVKQFNQKNSFMG